jgi:quinol monooxygenase YgiN
MTLFAKIEVLPAKIVEAKIDLNNLVHNTKKEDGCLGYDLYQSNENKAVFFIFEEWQDELSLKKHFDSQHIKDFGLAKKNWILGKIELNYVNKVE